MLFQQTRERNHQMKDFI